MPELAEVEKYRRLAEEAALGREIVRVYAPDTWYLKGGLTARAVRASTPGERRGRSTPTRCAASTVICERRWTICSRAAARTPATSCPSGPPRASAPKTAAPW